MNQYVSLLRGINVGGKNLIKMAELQACFVALGFDNVRTYLQSGNVLFGADVSDRSSLEERIEEAVFKTFEYRLRVMMRSYPEFKDIVAHAPKDFGSDPAHYRYDVIFLKEPLTSAEVIQMVSLKEGVDQATAGDGVLYFSRLSSKASQSRLTRIIGLPIYQSMTIRNWNTTSRLLSMLEAGSE